MLYVDPIIMRKYAHSRRKTLKLLVFINRISREFNLIIIPLKALYFTLVRPILEYGPVRWDPSAAAASRTTEWVQRTFSRRINSKFPFRNSFPSIEEDLSTNSIDFKFSVDLLNYDIDYTQIFFPAYHSISPHALHTVFF